MLDKEAAMLRLENAKLRSKIYELEKIAAADDTIIDLLGKGMVDYNQDVIGLTKQKMLNKSASQIKMLHNLVNSISVNPTNDVGFGKLADDENNKNTPGELIELFALGAV